MSLLGITRLISIGQSISAGSPTPFLENALEHEILRTLLSMLTGGKKKRLSHAQRRKKMNEKRRWFVDNIIMEHERIHRNNRKNAVASVYERIKHGPRTIENDGNKRWRELMAGEERNTRVKNIRGAIDARKLRARSRWMSIFAKQAN